MIKQISIAVLFILLVGCASQKVSPLLVQRQSRSEVISISPPPAVTRIPQDAQLYWNAPPDEDAGKVVSYIVYYSIDPDMLEAATIPVGNVTNAVVTGLIGGAQYYFAVSDLAADGSESDFSPIAPYTPALVMDLAFTFDQPVASIVVQTSADLVHWIDFGIVPDTGIWRVTANPLIPITFYRGVGLTTR